LIHSAYEYNRGSEIEDFWGYDRVHAYDGIDQDTWPST